MIKIEFPASRSDIAAAIGQALTTIGEGLPRNVQAEAYARGGVLAPEVAVVGEADSPEQWGTADVVTGPKPSLFVDDVTAYQEPEAEDTPPPEPGKTDDNGVPFNAEYCGNAAKPFYESGKTAGQWKKRKGVDQAAYDAWYTGELAKLAAPEEEPDFSAGSEFGAKPETAAAPAAGVPQNGGQFFQWVSENQNAGNIGQPDVDAAYAQTGISPTMLFTGDATGQASMCAALHAFLKTRGAQ